VSLTPVTLAGADDLFRGINPAYYHGGRLLSGVFFMKARDTKDDAPSVGIVKLISLQEFQSVTKPGWGVSRFPVSAPQSLELSVEPYADPEWGQYAQAHAVITGYQNWTNKRRDDVCRQMRNIAEKSIIVIPQP